MVRSEDQLSVVYKGRNTVFLLGCEHLISSLFLEPDLLQQEARISCFCLDAARRSVGVQGDSPGGPGGCDGSRAL